MLKNTMTKFFLVGLGVMALTSGCYYVSEDGVSGDANELTITTRWMEIDHIRTIDGKPMCNGKRDTEGKAIVTYEIWAPFACVGLKDVCKVRVEKSFDDTSTTEVTFTSADVIKGEVVECVSEVGEVCWDESWIQKKGEILSKDEIEDALDQTPEEFKEIPVNIEWKNSCNGTVMSLNAWVGVDSVTW